MGSGVSRVVMLLVRRCLERLRSGADGGAVAFAGLGYLSLYLAGKMHLFDRRGYSVRSFFSHGRFLMTDSRAQIKAWLALAPIIGATLIAISRTMGAFAASSALSSIANKSLTQTTAITRRTSSSEACSASSSPSSLTTSVRPSSHSLPIPHSTPSLATPHPSPTPTNSSTDYPSLASHSCHLPYAPRRPSPSVPDRKSVV